jgi:DNA-binding PadR family transcriptional regulator
VAPKKRKVDNLLALAVLSTVYGKPMHRYEMASVMKARGKDKQMDIKWGSLYTVVQNMEKHGFLETIGSSRSGARPERVVYRITEAGVREMLDWTRELVSTPTPEHRRFEAGLSVAMTLPPSEVAQLLHARLDHLTKTIADQRAQTEATAKEVPRLFLIEDDYTIAMLEAEANWVRSLVTQLDAGTFPDQGGWQRWHDTGFIPPEYVEMAERGTQPHD